MTVKRCIFIAMALLLVVGLSASLACAKPAPAPAPAPAPKAEPIVFKSVSFIPAKTKRAIAFQEWQEELNKRAGGEIIFEYIGGSEVIGGKQQPTATRAGAVQMSTVGGSHIKALVPEIGLLSLSRITAEEERQVGATEYIRKLCAEVGLYYVGRLDPKPQQNFYITSTEKIAKLEDFKGRMFGANGTYVEAMAKALGTSFTVISMPEAFGALERGMINIYCSSIDTQSKLGVAEVSKFVLDHPFYQSNTTIIINLDSWNSLPEHLKKLITDTYLDFEPQFIEGAYAGVIVGKKAFADEGAEFIKFSPADEKKFYDITYAAEAEAKIKELPDTGPEFLKLVKAMD